jgi:hypothetical protein
MRAMRKHYPLLVGALLLSSMAAHAVEKGQALSAALEELRASGIRLIFSTVLVQPGLTVTLDPGQGAPDEVARRILAPHGLTLESVQPGLYAVVKLPTSTSSAAKALPESDARPQGPERGTDQPLYEVDVYASRYVIDENAPAAALAELRREDVERLPGLNQDVMRVTRFLPGTASNSLSARTHIRGGRDDEQAVFFDGVPLFEPFHYKDVQSLLGLLDPGSISKIDFFSGVFPARYGNRLSGVLDIAPRTGSGEDYNEIGASVLYTHALSQGRLDSLPVEWLGSVRRGNISLFTELLDRDETRPDFLDALGRVKVGLGERSSLTAGWLLLDDRLRVDFERGTEQGNMSYRDATGWLSWQLRADDVGEVRATASRTERHTNRSGTLDRVDSAAGSLDDRRIFDTTTFRLEGSVKGGNFATVNAGIEWYDYEAKYDYQSRTQLNPLIAAAVGRPALRVNNTLLETEGEAYAAFASALLNISQHVSVDLALRWDAQRFDAQFDDNQLSPRLSLQYQYDPATAVRLSWGRMAQTERPDELQVQDGEAFYHAAQRSTQTVLSVERRVRENAILRVEAYDKRVTDPTPIYENIFDPFALLPELEADRIRVAPTGARIYGAELSLRWQLPQDWSGWTSYSWSQAADQFGDARALRTWDQKHSVATGLTWAKGRWQHSANVTWHSGWRRNALGTTDPSELFLEPRNANAWPAYFSLDVRTTWTKPIFYGALEVFAELDNLTNHSNDCCVSYSVGQSGALLTPQTSTWLPRLYLMGVTWRLP